MKTIKLSAIAMLSVAMMACSNEEKTEQTPVVEEVKKEACTYAYDASTTSVNWTAYKLSSKDAVKGKFDSVVVENVTVSEIAEDVLVGANFIISTSSLNSGDAERDPKIINSFFNVMKETSVITGNILEAKNGDAKIRLTMNNVSLEIPAKYEVIENELKLKTTLNIPDWGAQNALDALNKVCSVRHTGPDGVNKLWPNVEVVVSTTLKKECK
ncbi:MAG: YceI family protein [Bacteroidia bacterium]